MVIIVSLGKTIFSVWIDNRLCHDSNAYNLRMYTNDPNYTNSSDKINNVTDWLGGLRLYVFYLGTYLFALCVGIIQRFSLNNNY